MYTLITIQLPMPLGLFNQVMQAVHDYSAQNGLDLQIETEKGWVKVMAVNKKV